MGKGEGWNGEGEREGWNGEGEGWNGERGRMEWGRMERGRGCLFIKVFGHPYQFSITPA